LKIEGKAS